MATDILTTLEFDQIRVAVQRHCQFSLAADRALEIGPSSDPATVRYLLDVTAEAYTLLEDHAGLTVGGCRDIRQFVDRAAIGGMLLPEDLLQVGTTISAARSLKRSLRRIEDVAVRFPNIDEFAGFIEELPTLEAEIGRAISDRGDILDSASDALRAIRQSLRAAQSRLIERINRFLQNSAIQDPIVTMRDGRYVVPVRADRRGQMPGVVHDTSASGQTLFVEPMEVVELNNRWRELQAAERHEIERILTHLSQMVGAAADRLRRTVEAVAAIDLALAKARYASGIRATRPEISGNDTPRRLDLRRARHPLLDQNTVVPIDLVLGDDFRILVITGPNTGGKTVALKTVGLMAVMCQSGLFIPADEGSVLPVFDGIFADIGDEQSIEQSLSTFSSHMVRVIATLQAATSDSLVLLDELGAGTDPQEGAALARSVITELLGTGCLAVTTTHYSELKAFAYMTDGTENGSVEFNLQTLSPTYRLVVGVPGQSNALTIARRLGMPANIVERARTYLHPDTERADVLLEEIKRRRVDAESAQRESERLRRFAADAERKAAEALAEAELQRETARREALEEVEQELATARQAIRKVRELPPRMERNELKPAIEAARSDLDSAAQQVRKAERRRPPRRTTLVPLKVGDTVEITSLGGEGEILGFSDDHTEADIQMGAFKVRQPVTTLRRISGKKRSNTSPSMTLPPPRREVDMELHLRGQRTAGIDQLVDDYINNAYLSRLPYVRIIHGKGTGALREIVRDVVRRHPLVEKYETPPHYEGGDGVTVVYLRET